jgi:hypothetical protein
MAFNPNIAYLIILSFILAFATTAIMKNTIPFKEISDAQRYIDAITNGDNNSLGVRLLAPLITESTNDFITKTNFLFIFLIGYIIFTSTNSWRITLLALLGFSFSLLTYFSLLSQAIVIIVGLFLWTKVEVKGITNFFIYLIAGLFMVLTHKFGLMLWLAIVACKTISIPIKFEPWIKHIAIFSFVCAGALLLITAFSNPERVTFFYYFLLPISLGGFLDSIYWIGLFAMILWMLLKCENNTKELAMATVIFFGAIANYLFISHLEIDFLRILIFFELIAWVKIGQDKTNKYILKWLPWFLLAMAVERLILGLMM